MSKEMQTEYLTPKPGDFMVFKYDSKEYKPDEIKEFYEDMQYKFPNFGIVVIPKDLEFSLESGEDVWKLLESAVKLIRKKGFNI